ncbi:hypothetical protein ACFPRL_03525 [Pseudoclavibacter helvolus]
MTPEGSERPRERSHEGNRERTPERNPRAESESGVRQRSPRVKSAVDRARTWRVSGCQLPPKTRRS